MKKIISLLLTVAMLLSMAGIAVSAEEGNAAVFYHGANVTSGNRFQDSYVYLNKDIDAVKRVNESGADHYGGFNFAQVFDFKVTDYGTGSDHYTDFTFAHDLGAYHYGYSFTRKAFVVYTLYMPGSDPNKGSSILAEMSYDLKLDTWYEMTTRFVDKTITIYLNGIEMLSCNLDEAYPAIGDQKFIDDWNWTAKERADSFDNDLFFFHMIDVDMYLDNWAIYSGDYDISTGTASTTIVPMDSDMTSFNCNEDPSFAQWKHSDCGLSLDPNGGIPKITYNRGEAAGHVHEWGLNKELSSTQHCLTPGYDLYECVNGCGASEQRNYVAPAGHLPGYIDTVVIQADDENSGVERRVCTREGCGVTYTTISPLTGANNGALHMYTDGGTSVYNGQMGINQKELMALEKGFYFEFDIMPIAQLKDFSSIGAELGGNEHSYWVGYRYNLGKYVIEYNGEVIASSDKAFNNYEWQNWAVRHNDLKIEFLVDGEVLLSADVDPDIYTLTRVDEETGEVSTRTLQDCFNCVWYTPATELIIDNMISASPDFDLETRTGVIYSYMNFNEGEYVDDSGYVHNRNNNLQVLFAIAYNSATKAGYKVEAYGRPFEPVTAIHQDRVLHLDSDYENGSMFNYSQLHALSDGETGIDHMQKFVDSGDLEFSFDFYAYDWCTDEALLAKTYYNNVTTTDPETGEEITVKEPYTINGSAFIGGHVNSQGVGNANNPTGNGFAGYDLIKQQVVIGSVSDQAGGYYGENNVYAPYTVEKETWHRMTIKYDTEYVNDKANGATAENWDNDFVHISVLMDGKEVLTKSIDFWSINLDYFIFYPNFVKMYMDNVSVTIDGVVYDDAVDFTNAYSTSTAALDITGDGGSADWSLVDGGYPTHVYEETIFPASCLSDGYTTYDCSCGESTYTLYNLFATGHDWDDGVVTVEPTGSTKGEMTYTCLLCGETYTEEIATLFTYGDVNDDGAVDLQDVSLIKRFAKGNKVTMNADAADVNVDGAVDLQDVSLIKRFAKGNNVVLGPSA